MKKLIKLQSVFFALILLGFTTTFTACSSDDDDDDRVRVTDVIGMYTGEISIDPIVAEKADNADEPNVQVTNDSIKITNLPFEAIVKDYIQNEELIDDVLASIEAVNYGLSYTAVVNEKEDGLDLSIKAKDPIEINYYLANDEESTTREVNEEGEETENEPNKTLLVYIDAESEGVYKDKYLKFTLTVTDLAGEDISTFEGNDNEDTPEDEQGIYTYTFSLQKK